MNADCKLRIKPSSPQKKRATVPEAVLPTNLEVHPAPQHLPGPAVEDATGLLRLVVGYE